MSDVTSPPQLSGGIPRQPSWPASWCPRWTAFDVPRMWDMVEPEGKWSAMEQIAGFRALADLLLEHHRLWRGRRDFIAQVWQSPAAEQFLLRLDVYGNDMLIDAECARQTAYALDSTVSALSKAREQIAPLVGQWSTVTNDWIPEWWNHAAAKLNDEARQIMAEADRAIAAARPNISAPGRISSPYIDIRQMIEGDPDFPTSPSMATHGGARLRVPPIPGHDPLVAGQDRPTLAAINAPQLVPAVPGQAVSMLPISPGSPYAPFGGAYILPGPGVGGGGYVVPMPPGGRSPIGPRALTPPLAGVNGPGSAAAGGMMPVPMTSIAGAAGGSHGALYRRPNVTWHTDKGVPPVIRIEEDEFVPDQPTLKQEEEFRDWFTELAYPWRAEFKSSEGAQVTIRTVKQ
jgi:hypothetical protein